MSNQNAQGATQENQPQSKEAMTVEQRLDMNEHFLAEAMKGYQMAGQAINRLESYTFVLVDLVLKNNIATFDQLKELQTQLGAHDNLLAFWGVETKEDESASSAE